ncbi:hypothetical protein EDC01DRAFT_784464 [Geopyxis carbonaria]|nr:hypothetical protein EDC01DRAFT_784464 [Geopyxis carbonaria]
MAPDPDPPLPALLMHTPSGTREPYPQYGGGELIGTFCGPHGARCPNWPHPLSLGQQQVPEESRAEWERTHWRPYPYTDCRPEMKPLDLLNALIYTRMWASSGEMNRTMQWPELVRKEEAEQRVVIRFFENASKRQKKRAAKKVKRHAVKRRKRIAAGTEIENYDEEKKEKQREKEKREYWEGLKKADNEREEKMGKGREKEGKNLEGGMLSLRIE